ncbi:MAG TPA: hypothetical protein VFK05_26205 [Polyangiaceae bacterium]|nr:hypothetical protein [Polyangiaceae bacterium]
MPAARRALLLVSSPLANSQADFAELAEWSAAADPELRVRVVADLSGADLTDNEPDLPMLTVSFGPLQKLRPRRGAVFQGQHVAKSVEYRALQAIGVPVPRWTRLLPGQAPELELASFGPYVVTKPEFGARGADVRIERRAQARWTAPRTQLSEGFGGPFNPRLAQEFVYTGAWPHSYRVATLFTQTLWSLRIEASHAREPLRARSDFHGQSIVSSGKGCSLALSNDPAVIALAERASAALPHVALLGVDILRDADTGELFVVELNSLGYSWHFSSPAGGRFQAEFGFDLSAQFDGRRKAARLLARACREHAR